MGIYNNYPPYILGQEWVPIKEEVRALPRAASYVEYGYEFANTQSRTLSDIRYYIDDFPPGTHFGLNNEIMSAQIYAAGTEGLSGPIQRMLIPCNNGTITGTNTSIIGAPTVAQALLTPTDLSYVNVAFQDTYSVQAGFNAYFAGNTYAPLLTGKRILAINVLYNWTSATTLDVINRQGAGDLAVRMSLATDSSIYSVGTGHAVAQGPDTIFWDSQNDAAITRRVRSGSVNPFWNGVAMQSDFEVLPWIAADLQRFEIASANRYSIMVIFQAPSAPAFGFTIGTSWRYMALEVLFCEEQRLAVASRQNLFNITNNAVNFTNPMSLRNPTTRALNPVLAPGAYAVTVSSPDVAQAAADIGQSSHVDVNALRELYPMPSQGGIQLDIPYPLDASAEGKVFALEKSNIIPQISVHTSGGVVTDVHPYGRQAVAQVYGTITAIQEVQDSWANGSFSYPYVRYYARRFGNTVVPLRLASPEPALSGAANQVVLTPAQYDALPEIVNGWKEITLQFPTAPLMGNVVGAPAWTWSAPGEIAGNRWEVLGAWAPSLTGVPSTLLGMTATQQLGAASYDGSGTNEQWMIPSATVTTDDPNADAVILFSQYPPSVSGFAVTQQNQLLSTVNNNCGVSRACLPTALAYNRLTWTRRQATQFDTFSRIAASGWGSSNYGDPWTISVGPASFFSVDGSEGVHNHPASATSSYTITIPAGGPDQAVQVDVSSDTIDTSNDIQMELLFRYLDANNFYRARLFANSNQTMRLVLSKTIAGVTTNLVDINPLPGMTHAANVWYTIKAQVAGSVLFAKAWQRDMPEPLIWQANANDSTLTTGNSAALKSDKNSLTAVALNVFFDNFKVTPPEFGALEVQRYDPVDAVFKTIMLASNPGVTGFSDYEARAGQPSVYRIRERNVYDFAGLWSSQITGTLAAPAVTGASIGLLIFTSNFKQDGSRNLAYSAEWENNPTEDFAWREAGMVALQEMYSKNFPTAFHPTERGGEAFTRAVLVNVAGIPPATLANGFESLRDMAWDSLPYVCVRDELGNRWYANVQVPSGSRRRMVNAGHLNIASVSVIEVTDSPFQVDP